MSEYNELISVVVPIYNVEEYLSNCIDSILNQDYSNLEIILVDDGSTDNSGEISDKYAQNNKNITVIHKNNGGLSSARNAGLKKSNGKYIIFIDSDDWIDTKMISTLYDLIKNNNAEIAICGFLRTDGSDDKIQDNSKAKNIKTYTNMEAMLQLYNKECLTEFVVAWNKLYNIRLFNDIEYPEGKIHEDEFTTYKLFYKSKNIVYTDEKLYNYRITPNSIMNKAFNKNRLYALEAFKERTEFARNIGDNEFYMETLKRYCNLCIDCYSKCKSYLKDETLCQELKEQTKKVYYEYMRNDPEFNIDIVRFKAFFFNYTIYRCVNKIANKII